MNLRQIFNPYQLFWRVATVALGVALMVSVLFGYASISAAASMKADANVRAKSDVYQSNQNVPDYPEWYPDRPNLESRMDKVDANNRMTGEQKAGNPLRTAQRRLSETAEKAREQLGSDEAEMGGTARGKEVTGDVPTQVGKNLERAKDVFTTATEDVSQGKTPLYDRE